MSEVKIVATLEKIIVDFTCGEQAGTFEAIDLDSAINFLSFLKGTMSPSDFLAFAVETVSTESLQNYIEMVNVCIGQVS